MRPILLTCLTVTSLVSGCGSSSGPITMPPPLPTAVVFISQPPSTLAVSAAVSLGAAAIFPAGEVGGNTAVAWTVSCDSVGACGGFGASADAGASTYTAPSAIPAGGSVTVTATSLADSAISASATITIVPPIPIAVSLLPVPPASLQVAAHYALSATVSNDVTANPQVRWSTACAAANCGTFSIAQTATTMPTTYTAPPVIPAGGTIKVTATSVTDPTKSASALVVVTPAVANLADGTYVFQVTGEPGPQASFVTGAFTAKNGLITGGEQDSLSYSTDDNGDTIPLAATTLITGGSAATTPGGNLAVSLTLGPSAVEVLYGAPASGSHAFSATLLGMAGTGSLELQTAVAAPAGGFALVMYGGDANGGPAWLGGILNVDLPAGLSGAGSTLDVQDTQSNDTGSFAIGASTLSAPDLFGRVVLRLEPGAGSTLPALNVAGYVVDATHIRLIGAATAGGSGAFQGVLGGVALGQGSSPGGYSVASVAGSSWVLGAQGSDATGTLQLAGILTANADGTVTGKLSWNDPSTPAAQSPASVSGTYVVEPEGRVAISQLTDGATFHCSLYVYLAGAGTAVVRANDTADAFVGQAFLRDPAVTSISGNYALNAAYAPAANAASGTGPVIGSLAVTDTAPATQLTGYVDRGDGGADLSVHGQVMPSSSGALVGTLTGLIPNAPSTASGSAIYVIDANQAIVVGTDSSQLLLGLLQHVP